MLQVQEVVDKVNEAKNEESYFQDVIHYFNSKLAFFNAIEGALNKEELEKEEGGDYELYMDIQPEKSQLWDMLYDLNNQLVEIQGQISDLEYNEFALKNRYAS